MIVSFVEWLYHNTEIVNILQFNEMTFFYFCLPPIVFASGFNMQRGDFFRNINNVILLGVLGTIVAFASFSLMTLAFTSNLDLDVYYFDAGD